MALSACTAAPRLPDTAALDASIASQVAQQTPAPPSSIVLLGDSLTEAMPPVPGWVNYGLGGMRTDTLLLALPRYRLENARLVVLTIGTNDIGTKRTEGIADRLRLISASIPGPLIWNEVPPTWFGARGEVNAAIRTVCAERPDCALLATRFQPGDFTDGTHLNAVGYARWMAGLRVRIAETEGR